MTALANVVIVIGLCLLLVADLVIAGGLVVIAVRAVRRHRRRTQ